MNWNGVEWNGLTGHRMEGERGRIKYVNKALKL